MTPTFDLGRNYHYPNKLMRVVLLALDEVIGQAGVSAALNLAHLGRLVGRYPANTYDRAVNFLEIGRLMHALDQLYGPRSGRGVAQRAGQACFKYALREFGGDLGMADMTFRILPLTMKIKLGGEHMAEDLSRLSDQVVRLTDTPSQWLWQHVRCPLCWGRHTPEPACHLAVGVLQEALLWVSGGKRFDVLQTTGASCGDELCTFVIEKNPLD